MTLITITQNFGGEGMAIARKVADELGIELLNFISKDNPVVEGRERDGGC